MKRIFCTNTLFIPLFVRINAVLKRRRRGKKKKTFIILWFTKGEEFKALFLSREKIFQAKEEGISIYLAYLVEEYIRGGCVFLPLGRRNRNERCSQRRNLTHAEEEEEEEEAVTWWQLSIEQRSTSDPRRAPPSSSMKYPGSADNDLHGARSRERIVSPPV